ncbi:MAG TPA: hypothetical protein PLV12_11455, partial [Saprospiraceae bacterium]|nr:hypothetical protein [Saprospiraceae bacterium]
LHVPVPGTEQRSNGASGIGLPLSAVRLSTWLTPVRQACPCAGHWWRGTDCGFTNNGLTDCG